MQVDYFQIYSCMSEIQVPGACMFKLKNSNVQIEANALWESTTINGYIYTV